LLWYTVILTVVIGGAGGSLYYVTQRSAFEEFDAQIESQARGIAGLLTGSSAVDADRQLTADLARYFERPKPGPKPAEVRLDDPEGQPYYVVWGSNGAVVHASHRQWEVPPFEPKPSPHDPRKPRWRDRDTWREAVVAGPHGASVLVGRSTKEVRRHLQTFLVRLVASGAGALAVAMVGGWFLTGKALAPIDRISATAEAVSSSNLSQRISLEETDSEFGRLAGVLNGAFDRMEQALVRQVAFTADASHELRTPLAVVAASAELALRRDRSPEYYRNTLTQCCDAAHRMQRVIEKLLTLARADAVQVAPITEPIDLARLADDVVTRLLPLATARDVTCTVDLALATIEGDADQVALMLENIVENAIAYNRPSGMVSVRLTTAGASAVLEVTDNGIGIPPADQPHVFDRFYRVDKARARDSGGSGLGLAIARRIVEDHGGTIELTSSEATGTRVVVTLPLRSVS
jgi:heavy metal sensor kinase